MFNCYRFIKFVYIFYFRFYRFTITRLESNSYSCAILVPRVYLNSFFSVFDLTGGFLLLQIFSVAISVSPHVCFILVLILISMFPR